MRLAVDGGASGLRMCLLNGGEQPVGRVEVPGYQWTTGEDPIEQQCRRVEAAWAELGCPRPVEQIALGLAGGASDRASRERLAPLIAERLGARRVLLTGDDVINHLGVLGGRSGVVIAAGTGVACLAVTEAGTLRNVDGLGYLFGDLGGGFWLGLAGLRAALAAVEGRGPSTRLVGAANRVAGLAGTSDDDLDRVGPAKLAAAMRTWYASPTLVAAVAAFAAEVSVAAEPDPAEPPDPVAVSICEQAGDLLATSVHGAIRLAFRTDIEAENPPPVSWSGSVFGSRVIFDRFRKGLEVGPPAVALCEPRGDAMAGAIRLALGARVPHLSGVIIAEAA